MHITQITISRKKIQYGYLELDLPTIFDSTLMNKNLGLTLANFALRLGYVREVELFYFLPIHLGPKSNTANWMKMQ